MIPVQNPKNKIVMGVIFALLLIGGFVVWYTNTPRRNLGQSQELTQEEIDAGYEASARAMASSSPDFARRLAIIELPAIGNSNYKKDDNYVYFGTDTVVGADPKTFEIIDDQFAKDKNHIYYDGDVLEDSDSATFVVGAIPKDKSNVYLLLTCEDNQWDQCYRRVNGADPKTFELLSYGFSKDKSYVFYNTEIIPSADPMTFAVHDGGKYGYTYGYDKSNIYIRGENRIGVIKEKCNEVDNKATYYLGGYYLRCDNKIYYFDTWLTGADLKTFRTIGATNNYALDSKTVYFDGEIVVGADASTFDIGDGINAKDKNYTYRFGKRVE